MLPGKAMNKLRIFVDFAAPPDVLEMLQDGTREHQLVFPKTAASSVLARAERDPQFATVEVAFGQPDLQAIAGAGRLKWIHVSSSGFTRYDTPEFRSLMARRKIPVTNSASVYHEACATHMLSFMLAQARRLPVALRTRTAHGTDGWRDLRGSCVPLRGQTVLILGYGAIGRRLVEMLRPFDMKVLAYRRKARGDEGVPVVTGGRLAHALAHEADHVVNILPDNPESSYFFNEARFSALKPGAIFYNIGRGPTVDQAALLKALRSGRVGAAWLDVTDPEPLPDHHPLWAEPNCFITPHVAGGHREETKTLVRHFLNNFQRFVRHEPLLDRVM
jgi:phosphoglycerate dehydrogenase-like enzyme